ncbi:MAG: DUF1289 domain-containing protein [Zoogloeaceae bacterium]|nr:DUF1289 domain-containing protein [Zoogloeaceae bacterium]
MVIKSPCINICQMDTASGLCAGCFRSLAEIAAWGGASDAQKRDILSAVAERRRHATGSGKGGIGLQEVA